MFTVVIPTMWKYEPFLNSINHICNNILVEQVIIIDNNRDERPEDDILHHPKLKLLEQTTNIFVNPAWNLGVSEAQTEYICIMNDDVVFDTRVFEAIGPYMVEAKFGAAGVHPGEEHLGQLPFRDGQIDIVRWNPSESRSSTYFFGFGTLFFVKKSKWKPIPPDLSIYYGDDWVIMTNDTYDNDIYLITNILYASPSAQTCSSILTKDQRDFVLKAEADIYGLETAKYKAAVFQDFIMKEYESACETKSDIHEHLPTLKHLAEQCNSVVELGVREGWSTRAFLTVNNKLRSYDIVLWPYVSHLFKAMKSVGRDFEYIQANSLEVELDDCDMIFFDTEHTYQQLSKELALHGNKAQKYLVFHDTTSYETELMPAITEFVSRNEHWFIKERRYNNNGLLLLERIHD